ncbi:unnamed protein product [Cuscuta europaea]|uniref:DUF7086 domain-containing protein n=1 Tax=Cuscuta europaea TaxID=41803 RepID=A0A9P0ZBC7_CUSEU|nr:unnamed protein product [Cuscuta europaea]
MNNKRKNHEKENHQKDGGGDDGDVLQLSLACQESTHVPQFVLAQPPVPSSHSQLIPPRQVRRRRNLTETPHEGKSENVPSLFPWSTNKRATIQNLSYLMSNKIFTITGDVQCKRCERTYEMGFDLREKFYEIGKFIMENKENMHDRAPDVWRNPVLPTCRFCEQEKSIKPVIASSKKAINWLFLLLGQLLGCCTLEQLRYFCKHTQNHRTGAKDRILYLTYLSLCKQLDPTGPFDR